MKQSILDVLMYLFENYMDDDQFDYDQDNLAIELTAAGFPDEEVHKAFHWLESLAEQQINQDNSEIRNTAATRVYLKEECERLNVESRGFIVFLEQVGVLNTHNRELVIDRAMALDVDEFHLDHLKWVVLMILFNQPGQEAAFAWMEDLVYEQAVGYLH